MSNTTRKFRIPEIPQMPKIPKMSDVNFNRQMQKLKTRDMGVAAAFVGAIAILLLIACYVISRLERDRAHRARWRDYNDCGWA